MDEKQRLFETIKSGITGQKDLRKLGFTQFFLNNHRMIMIRRVKNPKPERIKNEKSVNISVAIGKKMMMSNFPKKYPPLQHNFIGKYGL